MIDLKRCNAFMIFDDIPKYQYLCNFGEIFSTVLNVRTTCFLAQRCLISSFSLRHWRNKKRFLDKFFNFKLVTNTGENNIHNANKYLIALENKYNEN